MSQKIERGQKPSKQSWTLFHVCRYVEKGKIEEGPMLYISIIIVIQRKTYVHIKRKRCMLSAQRI